MDTQTSENEKTEPRSPRQKRRRRQGPAKRTLLEGYLIEDELCAELDVVPRTARKWRQTGEGPPWASIGATIVYPIANFHKWLAKRVRTTTRGI
jgi:hypothetical protein